LAPIYEIFPLLCPYCAGPVPIIAFLTEPASVHPLLSHLSEPSAPPEVAPARGPPLWEPVDEPVADRGEAPAPLPEFVFDQRISW
jgi:hypothetical protein